MFNHLSKLAVTATAMIVTAGLPSAAVARPLIDPAGLYRADSAPVFQSVSALPAPQAQQGFQWDDAGLGAAGMLVLVGVGSGAAVVVRRRTGRALTG
jgi:hypothetical protein